MKFVYGFVIGWLTSFSLWAPSQEQNALSWYASCMTANLDSDFSQTYWGDKKAFCFYSTTQSYVENVDVEKLLYPLMK